MVTIKERIQEDVKAAMRAQDKPRVATIRLILAAIKQKEVDERITLDDAQLVALLDKMAKQRRESIAQFQQAQRDDLVAKETFELEIVKSYLPAPLSAEAIDNAIQTAITETGASTMKEMGKVMAALKPQLQGKADMAEVSKKIKALLG